jgi:hypothetical protein
METIPVYLERGEVASMSAHTVKRREEEEKNSNVYCIQFFSFLIFSSLNCLSLYKRKTILVLSFFSYSYKRKRRTV